MVADVLQGSRGGDKSGKRRRTHRRQASSGAGNRSTTDRGGMYRIQLFKNVAHPRDKLLVSGRTSGDRVCLQAADI